MRDEDERRKMRGEDSGKQGVSPLTPARAAPLCVEVQLDPNDVVGLSGRPPGSGEGEGRKEAGFVPELGGCQLGQSDLISHVFLALHPKPLAKIILQVHS